MVKDKCVITLGRYYGAGGAEIGRRLATKLHIPFYDKQILQMVSDDSGIKESYFHLADEKPGENLMYKIVKTMTPRLTKPSLGSDLLTDENLFRFQSELIMKLAEQQSCVIVGRCGDYLLREMDHVYKVFISADLSARIARIKEVQSIPEEEAEKRIRKMDKSREEYYRYYTGLQWDSTQHYDICLDSARLGYDGCVEVILKYIEERQKLNN